MPRVSDAHLAARRQQILEAAWRCFSQQGFHATSMQDVFAESGLSAGAVYRYFPSKADLVRTTAEGIAGIADDVFQQLLEADPPPGPIRHCAALSDTSSAWPPKGRPTAPRSPCTCGRRPCAIRRSTRSSP